MSWIAKLRNTFRPGRVDADLADEIRDHLARRTAALEQQGLDSVEAHRQAELWFGNAATVREESREIRMWSELEKTWQDIRYGIRGLRRRPALALTGVLSLSLAIGANTAIFSLVNAAFLRPLPVGDPHALVQLETSPSGDAAPAGLFSYPLYERLRAAAGPSARIALFTAPNRVEAQIDTAVASYEEATTQFVSPDAFDVLGVPPAAGQLFSVTADRYPSPRSVVVLSYRYWMRRFGGDAAALGRTLALDGRPYTVLGVARQGFTGVEPGRFVDAWLPVTQFDPGVFNNPDARLFRLMGRLAPGIGPRQLAARLDPRFRNFQNARLAEDAEMPAALRRRIESGSLAVSSASGGISALGRAYSKPLLVLAVVSFCILLIACSNLAGLLLARSASRASEIALRISLGARRGRLVRQLLTETLLILIAAAAIGRILAGFAAPALISLVSTPANPLTLDLKPDLRALLFSASICAISILLAGLAPALHTTGRGPAASLRQFGAAGGRLRMGRWFVAVQVAFAFCLVALGSGFVYSLRHLTSLDPGFRAQGVSVFTMTGTSQDHARQFELLRLSQQRIAALPDVQGAATAWMPVLSGARRAQRVMLDGRQAPTGEVTFYRVSPGYFSTLQTRLLAGRDLSWRDNDDEPVSTVVNRAFARLYFGTDAVIGREFRRDDGALHQIVGLAADSHFVDLRLGPEPIAYMPMKPTRAFTFYVRSGLDPVSLAKIVDREAHTLGSGLRVREVTSLDAIAGNTIVKERLLAYIGAAFALLGLALAAIGIFGLLNYSVTLRTSEIGVRGALGAGRAVIWNLIVRDSARMTAAGLVAGLVVSLPLLRMTQSLLYEVRAA
ncbi:MAG: ABC transporter permease, partial [Acidobacteriota bacterium]|nr:ABC transporter permease [Acidobacteriota bacterium]